MSRKIVVIGGGLSGLAAAWTLERAGADYTLIEVKRALGGSIHTDRRGGFISDSSQFILEKCADWPFLPALGMDEADALAPMGRYRDGALVAFTHGTGTLIDALAARLTRPVMMRMAVSSLGFLSRDETMCGVCLENGVMMEARGVIIAAPARYAERMLRSLNAQAAALLEDYQYDPTLRLNMGFRADDVPVSGDADDLPAPLKFVQVLGHDRLPARIPDGHVLVRAGMRVADLSDAQSAATAERLLREKLGITGESVYRHARLWPEGDPLTCFAPEHKATMAAIDALLPPHVRLTGSDYRARRLDALFADAEAQAQAVLAAIS